MTTIRIFLQQARRDRLTLPIWIVGTVLLLAVAGASVGQEYGDTAGRTSILTVALATPALLALRGIPHGASLGSAVHFQSFAFLAVTIGLMNIFLATRHGRADEEKGRRELVLAAPVSRLAAPVATLLLGLIANGIFVVLAIGGYLSAGVSLSGAVVSAVALGITGLAFLGLSMLAGELAETSRGANTIGVILVLGAYALRGAGDALGRPDVVKLTLQPAWPSWVSPIGWGQQTLAFTENRWWPVGLVAALAVVAVGVALRVHSRRELGASLLPERSGRAAALPTLRSPVGLAWRQQWPSLIAWAGGSALLGLVLGSFVAAFSKANIDSPQIQAVLQSLGHTDASDMGKTLITAVMVMVGAVAAAAGVQAVLRMRDEEVDGRLETVLASPRSRVGWLLSYTAVAAASVLIVLVATGVASAAGFAAVGQQSNAWLAMGSALVQAPAALSFVAATALFVGLLPRLAVTLGWAVFGILIGFGLFGGLLNLPKGWDKVSPIANVPALPTDDWVPTIVLGAIAVVATALGAMAMRRRDMST
ncbi:MAG: polyketide antibiotic transporter [Pseudolysinimonas sp.]